MSEKLQNTLIALLALLALCVVLCHNAKAAEPATKVIPFVHPIHPVPTPRHRDDKTLEYVAIAGITFVGIEVGVAAHNYSVGFKARF